MKRATIVLLATVLCGQAATIDSAPAPNPVSVEVNPPAQTAQQDEPYDLESLQPSTRGAPDIDAPTRGELRALMQYNPDGRDCGIDDAMRLVILERSQPIYRQDYCSAYTLGRTHLVTDLQGRHYVLLEYAEGHGTHATSTYLRIFEFTDLLDERARLPVSEPVGINADSTYDYRVTTPAGGGIVVNGRWTVSGVPGPYDISLPRTATSLQIDTVSNARQ